MKKKLSFGELLTVSVMLFGMFFGAGNLIFPVHMGQLAGHNVWWALLGFVVTGVGLTDDAVGRAVKLSHDKYCSATIMLAKTAEVVTSYERERLFERG